MSAKLNITLSIAAGLLGGVVSHYLVLARVYAQAQTPAPKEVRAQNFVLVNEQGVSLGLLGVGPQGKPVIRLLDGRGLVSLGFDPQGNPVITLLDERGRVSWSTREPFLRPPATGQ